MAKVIFLGDLHIGARNDNRFTALNQIKFFEDVLFPYMEKYNIKRVVQVGDVFDRRQYSNHKTLDLWKGRIFDVMKKRQIKIDALVGNHDAAYKNTLEVNSLDLFLSSYDNINVVSSPKVINVESIPMLFLPWICSGNYVESVEAINSTTVNFCVGHLELANFEMYKGQSMTDGMDKKIFKKFKKVMTGHYHTQSNDGKIFYLGTPYELTWIDFDDPKGFWVFDTETHDLEMIKNPYTMFNKLFYDDKDKGDDWWKGYKVSDLEGTYVKIIVVNKTDPYQFEKLVDKINALGVADLKIVDDMYSDIEDIGIDEEIEVEDTLSVIGSHCKKLDNYSKEVTSMLNSLYVEALGVIE